MGSCCNKTNAKLINEPNIINVLENSNPPNWKRGVLIGQGAYGRVYECLNLDTGELHAVKYIELQGSPDQILREVYNLKHQIFMLQNLSHKNIVQYLFTDLDPDCNGVNILMEYVPGGSLKYLLTKLGRFEEPMAALYVYQVLEGLEYLHSQGIIHRDIKSANILVSQEGLIKLSDFGASKKIRKCQLCKEELCKSLKGSPYWMAPEVANRSGHSYPADIWSVGCLVIELVTGNAPWSSISRSVKEVLHLIVLGQTPPIPEGVSESCRSFIEICLKPNPSDRPSASQLLQHDFIRKEQKSDVDNRNC
jgi:mitogen-activated protein kinase kinase kinase